VGEGPGAGGSAGGPAGRRDGGAAWGEAAPARTLALSVDCSELPGRRRRKHPVVSSHRLRSLAAVRLGDGAPRGGTRARSHPLEASPARPRPRPPPPGLCPHPRRTRRPASAPPRWLPRPLLPRQPRRQAVARLLGRHRLQPLRPEGPNACAPAGPRRTGEAKSALSADTPSAGGCPARAPPARHRPRRSARATTPWWSGPWPGDGLPRGAWCVRRSTAKAATGW
jgi:hypothetical protein